MGQEPTPELILKNMNAFSSMVIFYFESIEVEIYKDRIQFFM